MTGFQALRDTLSALPAHQLMDDVVRDVQAGKVAVVAAPTGSGKSMLLPSALADASDEQVVVLVPRRFLATDAAYNVAELSGTELGDEVGFALGQVNGEKSQHKHSTKLLFCTYGYALRSGLINTARTIVLDEVHEGDEHISLARAALHQRKQEDPSLQILEMSATVNAPAQAAFWKDVAQTIIHNVESTKPNCALLHESPMLAGNKGRSIEEVAIGLLEGDMGGKIHGVVPAAETAQTFAAMLDDQASAQKNVGRNGIAVFRGGIKEVEASVGELKRLLIERGIRNVEVVGIHGGTPSNERREARKPPKEGWKKIIVGTNVIESGVNLLWVDSGVSDGVRKVPHYRFDTGANTLVVEDLPQSGITQQMGRINRNAEKTGFSEGIFILHAKNDFGQRSKQNGPAIERESMLATAFHAASLGYDPTQLKWDVRQSHASDLPVRLEQAKQDLMRLELIRDDWSLTKEGKFINYLPVSPATGAMLNEAHYLDVQRSRERQPPRVLRDAIILAALAEGRNVKARSKEGHGGDQHATSDWLDAMNAYRTIAKEAERSGILGSLLRSTSEEFLATATAEELAELRPQHELLARLCDRHNMTEQGFIQTAHLVAEISKRLSMHKGIDLSPCKDETYDAARYDELKRCILNGHANTLFQFEQGGLRDLLRDYGKGKRDNGKPFNGYELADSSIVQKSAMADGTLVVGDLREVQPKPKPEKGGNSKKKKQAEDKSSDPLLVVGNATVIPPETFAGWVQGREERHRPIITDQHFANHALHARYADKAAFEMPMSQGMEIKAGDSKRDYLSRGKGGRQSKDWADWHASKAVFSMR